MIKRFILAAILALSFQPAFAEQQEVTSGAGAAHEWSVQKARINNNVADFNSKIDQAVKTTSNPVFNSVHAAGGNLAAANVQVVKQWLTDIAYTSGNTAVIRGGEVYVCTASHLSSSETEPGVGPSWNTAWKISTIPSCGDGEVLIYETVTDLWECSTISTLVSLFGSSDLITALDGLDLTLASVEVAPSPTPTLTFDDSNSGDADQTIIRQIGDATTTTAGAVVSDWLLQYKDGGDASGAFTDALLLDGSAGKLISYVGIETEQTITGKIATATDADAHTLTSAEYHGGVVVATGAQIDTLPSAAAGYSGCVEAGQGVAAIIQLLPGAGDFIVKNGVRGSAATSIKSTGVLGDWICYHAVNDSDWHIKYGGTWTE